MIDYALCYDQLNVSELACVMLAARQVQLSQVRWRDRMFGHNETGRLDNERNLYMGIYEGRGGLCIRPVLYEKGWRPFTPRGP